MDADLLNVTAPAPGEVVDNRSVLEAKFNNVMTLCAMLPLLAFTCLNSFLLWWVARGQSAEVERS